MLQRLVINNYKLIDSLEISFSPDLTIISGETGAGKSILLDALRLILGDRGSPQMIKNDDFPLIVEAFFTELDEITIRVLEKYEIELSNEIHIYRQINSSGKNTVRINGLPVNVKILNDIGKNILDLCSQNQHQSLFSRNNHKLLLDSFDRNNTHSLIKEIQQLRQQYLETKKQFNRENKDSC